MLAHYRVKSTVQLRHRRIFRGRVARRSFTAGLPEPWGWPTPGRADPLRYYRGPRHGAIDCLQRAVGHRPHATPTSGSRQTGAPPGFVGGEHTTDTNRAGHAGLRRTDADHDYGTVSDPGGPRFGGIRDTHSDGDLIRASRRRRHASTTEARWLLDDGGGAALRRIRRRRLQSVLVGLLKVMPVNPHSLGDKGEFTDIWSAARSGDSEHCPVSRPVADPAVRAFQRSVSSRSEGEQCPSYECSWSMTTKWCGEG